MVKLRINGMSCDHCVRAVVKALNRVQGVENVDVDLARGEAVVAGDADTALLVAAIEAEGYEAGPLA